MISLDDMRRELHEKFEKLSSFANKRSSNPNEKEYTYLEQLEDQKKDLENLMKDIRDQVNYCSPKAVRESLVARAFIHGLKDLLPNLKETLPAEIYAEQEDWVNKTNDTLFDLSGEFGEHCLCHRKSNPNDNLESLARKIKACQKTTGVTSCGECPARFSCPYLDELRVLRLSRWRS